MITLKFRLSKSKKILPGVTVNVSTNGASVSIGPRGAKLKLSKKGVDASVRIPKLGVSVSKRIIGRK